MARTGPLWEPVLLLFAQEFDEADVLYYLAHSRAHVSQVINGTMVPSANIKSAIESCLNLRA